MPRLFTGLEIPTSIRQSLSILRGGLPGARWIDPENYHLTLRFIGDVDDTVAHEVAHMIGQVKRTRFELRLEGLHGIAVHPAVLFEMNLEARSLLRLMVLRSDQMDDRIEHILPC